jgi:nitrogen regulatory protein P-II 1
MSEPALRVVVAFIRPFQLEPLVDALRALPNFPGMSVSRVEGFGRRKSHPPRAGEDTEVAAFRESTRVEIYCRAAEEQGIATTIRAVCHTGRPGDGKVFTALLGSALRIRTGEEGEDAILRGGAVG